VEAFQLAERLRVRRRGVDQLDTDLGELAHELDGDPEQAPGEAQVVVGEELAGQAVGGAGANEAAPGGLAARAGAGERAEQVTGVVVEAVEHPSLRALGERNLGRVDLPEVVRKRALEALARPAAPRPPRRDQLVALERLVDRRDGGRLEAGARKLAPP
jgi:hypothetical protein